jgi:hypothetical protein
MAEQDNETQSDLHPEHAPRVHEHLLWLNVL